ncbi:MAG TPA: peptidylprolyl isomerase [Chloroflexota bacterium]|nr:peptidylprolyl isomerase [Chloroflexota bacterium]
MSRRRESRRLREHRQRRLFWIAVAFVVAAIILIPTYGYWRENFYRGTVPIATVDGLDIPTETYARVLGFEQSALDRRIEELIELNNQLGPDSGLVGPLQQQADRLYQERIQLEMGLADRMVEDRLLVAAAAAEGVTVSPAEVDEYIDTQLIPAPIVTVLGEVTPEANPTEVPDMRGRMTALLAETNFLTEAEYREFIATPRLLRERMRDQLGQDVPTTSPQVHARHILVADEETALKAIERIKGGEAFEAVAAELSTDTSNKDQGGDLDWFGRGAMVGPFEEAVFGLEKGELSEPVQTQFGYHVIEVVDKDDARPIDEFALVQSRDQLLRQWLVGEREKALAEGRLSTDITPDKTEWARDYVARNTRPK